MVNRKGFCTVKRLTVCLTHVKLPLNNVKHVKSYFDWRDVYIYFMPNSVCYISRTAGPLPIQKKYLIGGYLTSGCRGWGGCLLLRKEQKSRNHCWCGFFQYYKASSKKSCKDSCPWIWTFCLTCLKLWTIFLLFAIFWFSVIISWFNSGKFSSLNKST